VIIIPGDKVSIVSTLADSLLRFLFGGKERIQFYAEVDVFTKVSTLDFPLKKGAYNYVV
jgi:hypothetical protein